MAINLGYYSCVIEAYDNKPKMRGTGEIKEKTDRALRGYREISKDTVSEDRKHAAEYDPEYGNSGLFKNDI